MVAHSCNPSYSGSSDQKDRGSKPAWPVPGVPISKTTITKKGWWSGSVLTLSSNPSTEKEKQIV
jgi:hypothetical protein